MANKILIKRSNVANKIPLAADLDVGELAVNLVDAKLYSKRPDGTVIELSSGNGYILDGLQDVSIATPQNNQYLVYESSTSLWKNKTVTITDPTDVAIAMAIALG
mgnify:CR=1 FL=1